MDHASLSATFVAINMQDLCMQRCGLTGYSKLTRNRNHIVKYNISTDTPFLHFNDHIVSDSASVFFPNVPKEKRWGQMAQVFTGQVSFLSPNQPCQSTNCHIKH